MAGLRDHSKLSVRKRRSIKQIAPALMLAQSVAAQGTCGFEKIIENRFFASEDFDSRDHPGNDRERIFRCSELVLVGPYHYPVESFWTFGFVLVVDNSIGADALDLALQRAIDRRVIRRTLHHRVLVGTNTGDI